MRWVEGGSCRHDAILRYFGDEAETLAGCGRCDVCRALDGAATRRTREDERRSIVRKALSGVARIHGRFGLGAAVKLLRGAADPRLERRRPRPHAAPSARSREQPEEWLAAPAAPLRHRGLGRLRGRASARSRCSPRRAAP